MKKADLYFGIGAFKEAAEAAYQTKNETVLKKLYQTTTNSAFKTELEKMLVELGFK